MLDKGDLEYAGELVVRMQSQRVLDHTEIGGPLFVLGAIKAARADLEFSAEHRRRGYLVASGYLSKAREAGFPEGREHEGLYLLGKSLIKSYQLSHGVEVLEEALHVDPEQVEDIHRLIAEAHFFSVQPVYGLVLKHLDHALATTELKEPERSEAFLLKAQTLAAMGRFDEAYQTLAEADAQVDAGRKLLVEGQLRVEQLQQLDGSSNATSEETAAMIATAEQNLKQAWAEDKLATHSGANKYLSAHLLKLKGNAADAMSLFEEVLQSHGEEPEGIAAAMAQGRLHQELNDDAAAIHKYRIALDAIDDPVSYRSELLPLSKLRAQVLAAQSTFVARHKHHAAAALVDRLYPVFSRSRQLELKADTYRTWGRYLIERSDAEQWTDEKLRAEGRAKLREAGLNYELLADLRFAKKRYPEHLWQSAEAYFEGQSYQSTLRVLRDYLKYEPEQRNAMALLRLGQTRLALGEPNEAIDAFNECIEFHPQDAATYRARLECAKAYRDVGEPDRAEALLNENLLGSTLAPQSPEWRDSKFELARLLHEHLRYDDAVRHLEEAILRYPDDRQVRLAKYLVAEAYRHAADVPMQLYIDAKTVNERERNRKKVSDYLGAALDNYDRVRREIAVQANWSEVDRAMIRNCYMFKGAVLFQQSVLDQDEAARAREERKLQLADELDAKAAASLAAAVQAYSDLSAQFQDEPIILEVFVQIAHCWRRMNDGIKARGQIALALELLNKLPRETDFAATTNLTRNEWEAMLQEMQKW